MNGLSLHIESPRTINPLFIISLFSRMDTDILINIKNSRDSVNILFDQNDSLGTSPLLPGGAGYFQGGGGHETILPVIGGVIFISIED